MNLELSLMGRLGDRRDCVPAERKTHKRAGRLRSVSIRDEITRRIADGRLPIGTRLPSEPELAAELSVSRATLREALQSLATDGLVHRRRGSGTFVLERPQMATNLDMNYGITAAIRAAGVRPGTREAGTEPSPRPPMTRRSSVSLLAQTCS